jgi:hypothetical protein
MSWSIIAVGKPAAVAAKVQADLAAHTCDEPEEGVKRAAGQAILAAINAQSPDTVVSVNASGSQRSVPGKGGFENTLIVNVTPIYSFVE